MKWYYYVEGYAFFGLIICLMISIPYHIETWVLIDNTVVSELTVFTIILAVLNFVMLIWMFNKYAPGID